MKRHGIIMEKMMILSSISLGVKTKLRPIAYGGLQAKLLQNVT